MKVVIVNTSEKIGGAAVASNRLMKALLKSNVHAKMLVRDKSTDDVNVLSINETKNDKRKNYFRFLFERVIIYIFNKFSKTNLFRVSIANTGSNISKHSLIKDADIIHLHWINQGFLSLKDIHKLCKLNKPIVWTMHDMWPCTGICHHARECTNYLSECGNCFFLNSSVKRDLSYFVFSKKKKIINDSNITFVCCSNWLSTKAKNSALTYNKKIVSIPNPIDTTIFKNLNSKNARIELGLPSHKYLLLFGALNVTDKQKGIDYLIDALKHLESIAPDIFEKIELVVFGQVKSEIRSLFNIPIHSMGYLSDENKIASLYNAVDVFITSSLEENLPNTIMEAMACGTPCVGFNTGGISEMIVHKQTGYVADYLSSNDLAQGIIWIINHPDKYDISSKSIEKANNFYSEKIIASKYIELYQECK